MRLFNKTFFKFTISFIGILAISFAFTIAVSIYENTTAHTAAVEEGAAVEESAD
jgi:hypothetical protein